MKKNFGVFNLLLIFIVFIYFDYVSKLWAIEDDIREFERLKNFGEDFVKLARAIYSHNDKRARIKRSINEFLGSKLIEEKSYASY